MRINNTMNNYYALVDNGRIVVGPRTYHRGFFREYYPDFEYPVTYESTDTIHITDTIKLCFVAPYQHPAHDDLTEQLAGPFWDQPINTDEPLIARFDVVDKPIYTIQGELKQLAAKKRYEIENTPVSYVDTVAGVVEIQTDRSNRMTWQSSMILGLGMQYKASNGEWYRFDAEDVKKISAAIHYAVQSAFNWEADITKRIMDASNKAEFESIRKEINSMTADKLR